MSHRSKETTKKSLVSSLINCFVAIITRSNTKVTGLYINNLIENVYSSKMPKLTKTELVSKKKLRAPPFTKEVIKNCFIQSLIFSKK